MTQPKLELTWIGKSNRPKLEPRILLEDPAKSYHAATRVTDHDQFNNHLIEPVSQQAVIIGNDSLFGDEP